MKRKKKNVFVFVAGITAIAVGFSILAFFAVRKICREINLQRLMDENVVVEIPDLDIKAPVLEGTSNDVLRQAAGHFKSLCS